MLPLRASPPGTTTEPIRPLTRAADGTFVFFFLAARLPWTSSALLLSSMGIRAWQMASAQACPSAPDAVTQ